MNENRKKLNVRVGNYIYTVEVSKMLLGNKWYAHFINPDIDDFTQTEPIAKKDIVEFIHEEYPERV